MRACAYLFCHISPSLFISLPRSISCCVDAFTILSDAFALSIPNILSSLLRSYSSVTSLSLTSLSASCFYSSSRMAKSSLLFCCLIISTRLIASSRFTLMAGIMPMVPEDLPNAWERRILCSDLTRCDEAPTCMFSRLVILKLPLILRLLVCLVSLFLSPPWEVCDFYANPLESIPSLLISLGYIGS